MSDQSLFEMSETGRQEDSRVTAAREIRKVRDSYQESLDRILVVVKGGANLPEMNAAVSAAHVFINMIAEIDKILAEFAANLKEKP